VKVVNHGSFPLVEPTTRILVSPCSSHEGLVLATEAAAREFVSNIRTQARNLGMQGSVEVIGLPPGI
jgi:hypothetical protein